jgi:hypothetical protein
MPVVRARNWLGQASYYHSVADGASSGIRYFSQLT